GNFNLGYSFRPIYAAVQPDGRVVLSGQQENVSPTKGVLARLLGNGPPPGFVATAPGVITVGGGYDGGEVQVLTQTGGAYAVAGTMTAFSGVNVRGTTADVTGD